MSELHVHAAAMYMYIHVINYRVQEVQIQTLAGHTYPSPLRSATATEYPNCSPNYEGYKNNKTDKTNYLFSIKKCCRNFSSTSNNVDLTGRVRHGTVLLMII